MFFFSVLAQSALRESALTWRLTPSPEASLCESVFGREGLPKCKRLSPSFLFQFKFYFLFKKENRKKVDFRVDLFIASGNLWLWHVNRVFLLEKHFSSTLSEVVNGEESAWREGAEDVSKCGKIESVDALFSCVRALWSRTPWSRTPWSRTLWTRTTKNPGQV